MNVTIVLNTATKVLDVDVNVGAGLLKLDDVRIGGMSVRALKMLRNALIASVGFPEGKEFDELGHDTDGLAGARDRITEYLGESIVTTTVRVCLCISSFSPDGTKCGCGGTLQTF